MDTLPERRIECGDCKKPIHFIYSEFVDKVLIYCGMCDDCPFLREKLLGQPLAAVGASCSVAKIQCGGCGLLLEEVKRGVSLGCPLCYEVFEEELLSELTTRKKIQNKNLPIKKGTSLHSGRRPGEGVGEEAPSAKLYALHQALTETLGREEYEQAAFLRDQIQELMKQAKHPQGSSAVGKKKQNGKKPPSEFSMEGRDEFYTPDDKLPPHSAKNNQTDT